MGRQLGWAQGLQQASQSCWRPPLRHPVYLPAVGALTAPLHADVYADTILEHVVVPTVKYALRDRTADVYVISATVTIWETVLVVSTPLGSIEIITPMVGRSCQNSILCAVATGLALGLSPVVSMLVCRWCLCARFVT